MRIQYSQVPVLIHVELVAGLYDILRSDTSFCLFHVERVFVDFDTLVHVLAFVGVRAVLLLIA